MSITYSPPLAINFIWNYSDSSIANPILEAVRKSFARDKDKPFSRGLNIPLFYFSTGSPNEAPLDKPIAVAKRNLIFVFTSTNTAGREEWKKYVEELPSSDDISIVPIAIDKNGQNHTGSLVGRNCVRAYDWPVENNELHAIVALAHEIYHYGCLKPDPKEQGKESSIKVFLSHSKAGDTGRLHSEKIKEFIDNTNMRRFFDATEISPGLPFGDEIEKHISDSTLVAIESDAYSSRYWCQREILSAKKNNRPILVVDCLAEYEDRIFPAASNVPCIRVSPLSPLQQEDILRILAAAILETIRYFHVMQCLELYKAETWVDNDCELTARPPEIRQVLMLKGAGAKKICYPEPPIYADEADWHQTLEVDTFTPLWNPSEKNIFSSLKIGISISEVNGDSFSSSHFHADHLIRLSQDIARHLLSRSATLIYGGDLRPGGFTEFILDEAEILKERIKSTQPNVENHLAWPLYVSEPEVTSWRAKYSGVMRTKEHNIPPDIASDIDSKIRLPPSTPKNLYIWSRCLTEMREQSISSSNARICAGGKSSGYKGKMPGVLEEIILALDQNKPVFLLGAFGGIVRDICQAISGGNFPETLTENWQISHNAGYIDVQGIARTHGKSCDYEAIKTSLQSVQLSQLSSQCGLEEEEYKRLMSSPFLDECTHLMLKGLKKIRSA